MEKSGVVAIIGRPNAGKSTLLNRVLGTKLSIVSHKAQTTRDRVLGIFQEEGKGQMVILDTPGVHSAKDGGVNEFMMNEVEKALHEPDLVWYLVDPESPIKREETVIETLKKTISAETPVFLIITKSDLKISRTRLAEKAEGLGTLYPFKKSFLISSDKDKGVTELLSDSWDILEVGEKLYPDDDSISDKPVRFFVGEFIREQLFHRLGEELPYACAIKIDHFKEAETPIKIQATIFVERESQKGIVIGKAAAKIKEISMNARQTITDFLGVPVVLVLKVDALKDWSRNAKALEKLGYQLPKASAGKTAVKAKAKKTARDARRDAKAKNP